MDWTTLKDFLEGVVIILGLPLACLGIYRMQRRQIEAKEETNHHLRRDLLSLQEKFRSFSEEVIAKNREAWSRIQEEEGALLVSQRERTLESFGAQFAAFEKRLLSVQEDLGHLKGSLLGTFEAFYDHRRHALLTREAAGVASWDLLAETHRKHMEGPFGAGTMGALEENPSKVEMGSASAGGD
jgi:hypothetical protein